MASLSHHSHSRGAAVRFVVDYRSTTMTYQIEASWGSEALYLADLHRADLERLREALDYVLTEVPEGDTDGPYFRAQDD